MTMEAVLKGGLDLRTAKSKVMPGRLLDCKNYEATTDQDGYGTIGGFERFDGRISPSSHDVWQMTVPRAAVAGIFTVGENITWELDGDTGDMGVAAVVFVLEHASAGADLIITFVYWEATDYIPDGATITGDDSGATFTYDLVVHTLEHVTVYAADAADLLSELDTVSDALRAPITKVPGMGPVLGIKRFEQQAYAVRNHFHVGFDGGDVAPSNHQRILDASGNEGIVFGASLDSGSYGAGTAAGKIIIDALTPAFSVANDDQFDLLGEVYFDSGSEEPSPGDTLSGATSGVTAVVHRVDVHTGTWVGGDAAGVIYVKTESGQFDFSTPDNLDNDTTTDSNVATVVDHPLQGADASLDATADVFIDEADAGLWRSTRTGWERIPLGWKLDYDTGTNEPPAIALGGSDSDVASEQATTDWYTPGTVTEQADGYEAWTSVTAAELTTDDGTEATVALSGSGGYDRKSAEAWATNFGFNLESNDAPLGFEVEFRARNITAANKGAIVVDRLFVDNTSPSVRSVDNKSSGFVLTSAVEQTVTFGGAADDWGGFYNGPLSATQINSTDFGLQFFISRQLNTGSQTFAVDRLRMRITYLPAGSKVYFWDSVNSEDYGQADITNDYVRSGTYAGSDAAGTYSLANLTRYDIAAGFQIRSAVGGGGVLYGVVTSAPTRVSMPGYSALVDNASLYEMMEHNFYASDDLNALWGVSGAGLAFVWDGNYFRQIRTGTAEARDKPRHLEAFQFRLVLGYSWGELNWSVAGTPLSFDGSLNAAATGFGFKIVGLKKLSGQMLGVFTDGGVFGALVSGSNFDQQILSPGSKVVEYSVQKFGNQVVFCDQSGVRDLSSSEKYGDFEPGTLSSDVNKWLRPRLRQVAGTGPRNRNFVNSTIVRSKGQYRMFFADGWVLTMTFDYQDPPEFTLQKLWLDDKEEAYVRVFATDSEQDDDGTEHVYFSVSAREDYEHGDDLGFVFQSERGTSFDGDPISGYCTLSWLNGADPISNKRYTKWILEGMAFNYATPTADFAVDFADPDGTGAETLVIGASDNAAILESRAFFTKFRSQKRGRNIALRFDYSASPTDGFLLIESSGDPLLLESGDTDEDYLILESTVISTKLPHLLQLVYSVDESPGRKEV